MIAARVCNWSAWSPGLEDPVAWRQWASNPRELSGEGRPRADFLPAMLRRRCGTLARILLTAAFGCCEDVEISELGSVFASRHGNINESIDLLQRLAEDKPLSPTRFSHTVHNAQAGLFSIASANRQPSSSVAAQQDSFACGYLEALTLLERYPQRQVLLVMGDVPLAPDFASMVDEPAGSYGLALRLEVCTEDDAVTFGIAPGDTPTSRPPWPDAIEFLRWCLSDEPVLTLGRGRRAWHWQRNTAETTAAA